MHSCSQQLLVLHLLKCSCGLILFYYCTTVSEAPSSAQLNVAQVNYMGDNLFQLFIYGKSYFLENSVAELLNSYSVATVICNLTQFFSSEMHHCWQSLQSRTALKGQIIVLSSGNFWKRCSRRTFHPFLDPCCVCSLPNVCLRLRFVPTFPWKRKTFPYKEVGCPDCHA